MIIIVSLVFFLIGFCVVAGLYVGMVHAIAYFLSTSLQAVLIPSAILTATLILIVFKMTSNMMQFLIDNETDNKDDDPIPVFIPARKLNRRKKNL